MGGYLFCDECGKYYELQPGELPTEFDDKCDCGGNLRFVNSIEGLKEDKSVQTKQINQKSKISNEDKQLIKGQSIIPPIIKTNVFKCPDCGHKVSKDANDCPNCGRHLTEKDKGKRDYFTLCCGACILIFIIIIIFGSILRMLGYNPIG